MYETILGRTKEDFENFQNRGCGYIGKHIIGKGEDTHLTTKVFLDLIRPHIIRISGKRGMGNSYSGGTIAEEIAQLPEEFKQNLAVLIIDTMGILWSLKKKNEQQVYLLREWNLEPKGFENVNIFVPYLQMEEFQKAGIPVDTGLSILPHEFSAEEWRLAFNLKITEPAGVSLEKNVNELLEEKENFTIDDIIFKIRDDKGTSQEVKNVLINLLSVAKKWGVFGERGINIGDIIQPGKISVIDVSHLRATEAWGVRNFIVAILSRKIYQERVIARKEEEIAKIDRTEPSRKFPMVWMIVDEAHNFCGTEPSVSQGPILSIAKQGREPGISLVVITRMPSKIHQDILSQCDIVFSHRITSRDDLQALHAVYQVYMMEDIEKLINKLPRWPGATLVLDDNLEKIFSVNIRPRYSWHAGGTAVIV
jgi:hypothetical protein